MQDFLDHLINSPGKDLTEFGLVIRTVIVYIGAILLVRLGKKRFMGSHAALDMIMGVMLGSILSRAVNGTAGVTSSLIAGVVMVGLHWLFSWLAYRSQAFGWIVKGACHELAVDGRLMKDNMKSAFISTHDLEEAFRQEQVGELESVRLATLERSGRISVVPKKDLPKILDIGVSEGVQTVRLEIV